MEYFYIHTCRVEPGFLRTGTLIACTTANLIKLTENTNYTTINKGYA